MAANNPSKNNLKNRKNNSVVEETKGFFENYGCAKIFGGDNPIYVKIFWVSILFGSLAGLVLMVRLRISNFIEISDATSYLGVGVLWLKNGVVFIFYILLGHCFQIDK